MELQARCRHIAAECNQREKWGLPPAALDDLCQQVLRFLSSDDSPTELYKVIYHYFHDGPQVEVMMQPGHPEGERCWEAVRVWFIQRATHYGVTLSEAEDVAQEAWQRARQSLRSFSFRSRLRTWLGAIILHACQDWHRRQGMPIISLDPSEAITLAETVTDAQTETPEEVLLREERAMLLDITLRRLLSHRDVLILRYSFFERYGIEETDGVRRVFQWTDERIAQQVGLAPSSVPTIRKRILERLRSNPELVRLVKEIFGPDWLSPSGEVSDSERVIRLEE